MCRLSNICKTGDLDDVDDNNDDDEDASLGRDENAEQLPGAFSLLAPYSLVVPVLLLAVADSLLAPQSGALRITPLRDFQPNPIPIPSTYSFRAFKPFNGDLKQPKQTKADQCRPRQTKADQGRPR